MPNPERHRWIALRLQPRSGLVPDNTARMVGARSHCSFIFPSPVLEAQGRFRMRLYLALKNRRCLMNFSNAAQHCIGLISSMVGARLSHHDTSEMANHFSGMQDLRGLSH